MTKLRLEISGFNKALNNMTINGKYQKVKKVRRSNLRYVEFETDEKVSQVSICKTHEYVGKLWWLWNLVYFFVSIFGLFDNKIDKRCGIIDCKFKVNTEKDTVVKLEVQNFGENDKFANIESESNVTEIANVFKFDTEAQKKHKKMIKIKKWAFVGFIAVVAVITALVIIL